MSITNIRRFTWPCPSYLSKEEEVPFFENSVVLNFPIISPTEKILPLEHTDFSCPVMFYSWLVSTRMTVSSGKWVSQRRAGMIPKKNVSSREPDLGAPGAGTGVGRRTLLNQKHTLNTTS